MYQHTLKLKRQWDYVTQLLCRDTQITREWVTLSSSTAKKQNLEHALKSAWAEHHALALNFNSNECLEDAALFSVYTSTLSVLVQLSAVYRTVLEQFKPLRRKLFQLADPDTMLKFNNLP